MTRSLRQYKRQQRCRQCKRQIELFGRRGHEPRPTEKGASELHSHTHTAGDSCQLTGGTLTLTGFRTMFHLWTVPFLALHLISLLLDRSIGQPKTYLPAKLTSFRLHVCFSHLLCRAQLKHLHPVTIWEPFASETISTAICLVMSHSRSHSRRRH